MSLTDGPSEIKWGAFTTSKVPVWVMGSISISLHADDVSGDVRERTRGLGSDQVAEHRD